MFVHGMGRTSRSGRRLLQTLARSGMRTSTFGYMVSLETFSTIVNRLQDRIRNFADRGDYILVGHSLGGVLLRAALQGHRPARPPLRLFLLGSPFLPSRIARGLGKNPVYRILTRDCGQLLGSSERMAKIEPMPVPITNIAGTRQLGLTARVFKGVPNDGVVAVEEVTHDTVTDCVYLDERHTWLPANRHVAAIVLDRIGL